MLTPRKLRISGLAFFILVLIVLFALNSPKQAQGIKKNDNGEKYTITSNKLIDSTNDDKIDDAINNEIKLNKQEEESPETNTQPKKPKPSVEFDPAKALVEIRTLSPMVVFSKTYCPYSKKLKQLLKDNYEITPEPRIVELDKHENGEDLQSYLYEVTDRRTVPNLLVGSTNKSRGGYDDIVKLHNEGRLLELLNEWGNKKLVVKKKETPSNA